MTTGHELGSDFLFRYSRRISSKDATPAYLKLLKIHRSIHPFVKKANTSMLHFTTEAWRHGFVEKSVKN